MNEFKLIEDNGGAGLAGDFKEGEKVFEMGVDATIGDEADEVKALA